MLSLIERRPLPDLVRDRILRPLGMTSTGYALTDQTRQGFAVPHDERRRPVPAWPTPRLGGAGGLRSTLPDLLRFAAAGLPGVPSDVQDAMAVAKTPHLATAPKRSVSLGWHARHLVDHDVFWHSGETAGSRACIVLDDATGLALTC